MYSVFSYCGQDYNFRNKISGMLIDGTLIEDEKIIANHVCDYYLNLYKEGNVIDNQAIPERVEPLVTKNQNATLTAFPTECDIYDTICEMGLTSALGLDGFGGLFFKSCRDIIKADLVALV